MVVGWGLPYEAHSVSRRFLYLFHLYAQSLQASAIVPELLQQASRGEIVSPVPFAPAPLLRVTSENAHQEFPIILKIKSKLLRQSLRVFHDITLTFISVDIP